MTANTIMKTCLFNKPSLVYHKNRFLNLKYILTYSNEQKLKIAICNIVNMLVVKRNRDPGSLNAGRKALLKLETLLVTKSWSHVNKAWAYSKAKEVSIRLYFE